MVDLWHVHAGVALDGGELGGHVDVHVALVLLYVGLLVLLATGVIQHVAATTDTNVLTQTLMKTIDYTNLVTQQLLKNSN